MRIAKTIPYSFLATILWASTASAQYILPGTGTTQATSGVTVTRPANTDPANANRTGTSALPFVDDVFLNSVTFGATTFSGGTGQFRGVGNVNVVSGAANVNAEYGDSDSATDGNPNPFVLGGVGGADPESTDPAVQRPSIRAAFNSLSLVQGVDGEGGGYTLDLIFQRGINDNNATAADSVPELVFFERGANSSYTVQLITGGTFLNPIFAPLSVTVNSGDAAQARRTGYFIDTVEITAGQELAATGLDLNSFFGAGVTATTVFGVRITDLNGSDLYGNFLSAASTSQFVPVPTALQGDGFLAEPVVVPEAGAGLLTLLGGVPALLGMAVLRRRRRATK